MVTSSRYKGWCARAAVLQSQTPSADGQASALGLCCRNALSSFLSVCLCLCPSLFSHLGLIAINFQQARALGPTEPLMPAASLQDP